MSCCLSEAAAPLGMYQMLNKFMNQRGWGMLMPFMHEDLLTLNHFPIDYSVVVSSRSTNKLRLMDGWPCFGGYVWHSESMVGQLGSTMYTFAHVLPSSPWCLVTRAEGLPVFLLPRSAANQSMLDV